MLERRQARMGGGVVAFDLHGFTVEEAPNRANVVSRGAAGLAYGTPRRAVTVLGSR